MASTSFVLKAKMMSAASAMSQIVIADAHGTRYHIPDVTAIDA